MRKFLLSGLLLATAAGAQAQIVSSQFGAPDPGIPAGADLIFDFEQATPELTGDVQLVTGSVGGAYAAPAGDTTQYAVVPMAGQPMGVAILDLTGLGRDVFDFGLYWGSIDDYNFLDFFNGNTLIGTVSGALIPPANGNQTANVTNRRVNVRFAGGQAITSVRFRSEGVAFEFDDIAVTAVPEPATWGLMIAGFAMVGAAARRRNANARIVTA